MRAGCGERAAGLHRPPHWHGGQRLAVRRHDADDGRAVRLNPVGAHDASHGSGLVELQRDRHAAAGLHRHAPAGDLDGRLGTGLVHAAHGRRGLRLRDARHAVRPRARAGGAVAHAHRVRRHRHRLRGHEPRGRLHDPLPEGRREPARRRGRFARLRRAADGQDAGGRLHLNRRRRPHRDGMERGPP